MGKPPITEFICLVKENDPSLSMNPGKRMNVKFMTMDDAIKQGLIKRHCKNSELSDVRKKLPLEPKATSLGKLWRLVFSKRENGAIDEEAARDDSSAVDRGPSIRGSGDGIGSDADSSLPDGPSTSLSGITSPATGVRAGEPEAFESCHRSPPALSVEEKSSPNTHKKYWGTSDYSSATGTSEWNLRAATESERNEAALKQLVARRRSSSYDSGRLGTLSSLSSDSSVSITESDQEGTAAVGESRHGAESGRTTQETMSERPSARRENLPLYEYPEPALSPVAASIGEVPDIVVIRNSHHTTPNISMNCHKSFRRGSLRLAAGFATFLQIILIIYFSDRVAILKQLLRRLGPRSPQLVDAMMEAIREDNHEVVLLLIDDFSCKVDTKSSAGEYPIHIAVKKHRYLILKILVNVGGASLYKKDGSGTTALEYAVALDFGDMVGFLCRRGAKVPPHCLRLALKCQNYKMAQYLLELGAEVDDECFEAIKRGWNEETVAKLAKVLKHFQEQNNGRARRGVKSGVPLEDSERRFGKT